MKRARTLSLLILFLAIVLGCGKFKKVEPGVGEWQRLGECEVKIDSVSVGKVKGKGMFGPAESQDEVLIVRTLFRNVDSSVEVKHSPWQSDSSLLLVGLSLTDDKNTRYSTVHFGMFADVDGRQKGDAELKSTDAPVADMVTFEAKAAQASVLFLELPPQWFRQTSEGWAYNSLKQGEKFRFRIPRSAWESNKPAEVKK